MILGRPPSDVSDLITGKRSISLDIAKELAAAFGTESEYWLSIDSAYQLTLSGEADQAIARRAKVYRYAPVWEMAKRHWLELSDDVEKLENSVKNFYGVTTLDDPINLPHAARRGTAEITPAEWAWLFRARHLAGAVQAAPFSIRTFKHRIGNLKQLLLSAPEARRAPEILADAGIRLLVVEPLCKTGIDGATFWIDSKSPVIVLSLRWDRIDCFWFTLAHELGHVAHQDALSIDPDLVGEGTQPSEDEVEVRANQYATDFLIPKASLDDFILRTSPLYAKQRVLAFAARMGVHPGIVVGQLQFRREIEWSTFRPLLEKVKDAVTQSTLTDGWGHLPQVLEY
jgi:HTH-type transcriptional regulator/antitoxin HigA